MARIRLADYVTRLRPKMKPCHRQICAFTLKQEQLEARHFLAANLLITEFMANNDGALLDGDGNSSDWIEVHNDGDEAIDILGYRLTDTATELDRWTFPSRNMEPGDFLIVFASGQETPNYVDADGNPHTNFRLGAGGEYLGLVAPDGSVVSQYGSTSEDYPRQLSNTSYGVAIDGANPELPAKVGFMTTPTPGSTNVPSDQIALGVAGNVGISAASGYYDEAFTVELDHDTPNGQIFYTTDSSRPSATNGTLYEEPIAIDSSTVVRAAVILPDYLPGKIATNTYIFLDDVLSQDGADHPPTWGTLGIPREEVLPDTPGCNNTSGDPAIANYTMDPRVVNDPRYADTIRDDLKSVPMMSLVLDPEDLWSEESGIYSNPLGEGFEWERPVNVELTGIDGETEFDIDAGIRIHGGWGRCPTQTNKHSLRLMFRNEYGSPKLEYPMFGEDATQSFDTFVLRANFNHSWATSGDIRTTFINDYFAAQTQTEMGWVAPRGAWVQLYINGLYWGLYNPMERPSAPFAADYFGGDKDEYDVLVVGTPTDGDGEAMEELMSLVRADEIDYDAVQEVLDIEPFVDYLIVNQYGGNWDWPQNNWYASRRDVEGGKWYFQMWDAEGMFGNGLSENRVSQTGSILGELYRNLRDNVEEFRVTYADRIQKHFFNEGLLTPSVNIDRLNRLAAPIDRAVVGESARWGDGRNDQVSPPRTRDDDWLPRLDELRTEYFPERGNRVIEQFAAVGLWPSTAAPQLNRHGGPVNPGFDLTMSSAGGIGTIYYSLDGTDPRLVGGDVSPNAVVYGGQSLTIDDDALVKARVLNDGEWSPLTEAQFFVTGLRITEVNYHPHDPNPVPGLNEPDVDNSAFEFIEVANVGNQPLELTGSTITGGVKFDFPDNTVLAANQRALIVANTDAFQARYGTESTILGEFVGDLSDVGEQVELIDAQGGSIAKLVYSASGQFPERANGQGSTLELADPTGGYSTSNWQPSGEFGGSPGAAGAGSSGEVVINEIVAYGDSPEVDMIELFNLSSQPTNMSNWYVGNPATDPFRGQLGEIETIAGGGYGLLSEVDLGFALDIARGDNIAIVEADANGVPLRFVHQVTFDPASPGIAIGALPDRNGTWLPLSENTLGAPNTGLRTGDLIVSEVNFDPADLDGDRGQRIDNWEFVELYNNTDQTLDITGWRISGALNLVLDEDMTVGPNETLVFVRFNPSSAAASVFKFIYGMNPQTELAARYRGKLNDEEGTIRIERPVDPTDENTAYIYVDEMTYGVLPPFETGASKTGNSFNRRFPAAFGNAASSWAILTATPGSVDFSAPPRLTGDSNEDGVFNQLDIVSVLSGGKYNTGQPATFADGDWTGDGVFNQLDIVAALQAGTYSTSANAAIGLAKPVTDEHDSVFEDWEDLRVRPI